MLIPSTAGSAQDQPSLGEVARQARKDREKNAAQPKTVITDDNLPSSKVLGGLSDLGSSKSAGGGNAMSRALEGLERAETALNKMDPMDRTTLAKAALLDNDVDFQTAADGKINYIQQSNSTSLMAGNSSGR